MISNILFEKRKGIVFEVLEHFPDTHRQTQAGDHAGFIQASLCKTFNVLVEIKGTLWTFFQLDHPSILHSVSKKKS